MMTLRDDEYLLIFVFMFWAPRHDATRYAAETMRKYPPVQALARVCTKPFRVPGTDVDLDVGTAVLIPVYALHHDPQYYPAPDAFDPDRFTKDDVAKRPAGTYLPFGDGPRICIGNACPRLAASHRDA